MKTRYKRLVRKRVDAALRLRRPIANDDEVMVTIDPFDELEPERIELDDTFSESV